MPGLPPAVGREGRQRERPDEPAWSETLVYVESSCSGAGVSRNGPEKLQRFLQFTFLHAGAGRRNEAGSFAPRFLVVAPAETLNDSCNLGAHRNCCTLLPASSRSGWSESKALQSSTIAVGIMRAGALPQRLLTKHHRTVIGNFTFDMSCL
jgi:hypothetical protein